MKRWLIVVSLALLLSSCEQEIDPKEAAIQREVAKRVEVARIEMKVDEDRRQTIRFVVCTVVTGGVLVCALYCITRRHPTAQNQRPDVTTTVNPSLGTSSRILEPPQGSRRPFGD